MLRKITNSGLLADRPNPLTVPNTYYFATDENKYYSAEGEVWVEREIDMEDLSPETDAVLVCGLSANGAVNPIKVSSEGYMIAGGVGGSVTATAGTISTLHVSQKVFDANPDRQFLYILNSSNADMYVGIGFTPTMTHGIFLHKTGGSIMFNSYFVPTQQINIIGDGANKTFTAIEG
jgi:hypothetical protein